MMRRYILTGLVLCVTCFLIDESGVQAAVPIGKERRGGAVVPGGGSVVPGARGTVGSRNGPERGIIGAKWPALPGGGVIGRSGELARRHHWLVEYRRSYGHPYRRLHPWWRRRFLLSVWLGENWWWWQANATDRPTTQSTSGGGKVAVMIPGAPVPGSAASGTVMAQGNVAVAPYVFASAQNVTASDLSLRVESMGVLDGLDATADQLTQLQKMAAVGTSGVKIVDASSINEQAAGHKDCLAALDELNRDLVQNDQDRAAVDRDKLEGAEEKDGLYLNPTVQMTAAGREQALGILDLLTSTQIAGYLAQRSESVADVKQILVAAMDEGRGLPEDHFGELRDRVAEQVDVLVNGLKPEPNQATIGQVDGLLNDVHALADDDFASRRASFEARAGRISGSMEPIDVLEHWLQWDMAVFLSNPQSPGMLKVRLARAIDEQRTQAQPQ